MGKTDPGWPGVQSNPLTIFNNLAYIAFPILPYEIFIFLPIIWAYFVEKPHPKITVPRLIVAITYFGAIYGGGVHTVAALAVLSGMPDIGAGHGLCRALPPVSASPWCALLTWHVILAVPMGYTFIYLVYRDYKMSGYKGLAGLLYWNGDNEKFTMFWRAGFFFATLGFSGDLPYFGEFAEQGLDVFDGTGVYAGTTWANWYTGRGVVEFGSYCSWLLFGIYFLVRAIMEKQQQEPKENPATLVHPHNAVKPNKVGATMDTE
mmetsp:Transcript_79300/g.175959  ORF Transcript_79300/g.175959 Transcript_79300/m.175959 type:complete len:262 (-) Transcript_79300:93-878(-)